MRYVQYGIVLCSTYRIVLSYIVQDSIVLYYIVLYCIVLNCIILYSVVLYCIVLYSVYARTYVKNPFLIIYYCFSFMHSIISITLTHSLSHSLSLFVFKG